MTTEILRPELDPLPDHMRSLPVHRGYPVPWFVAWITDEAGEQVPEFRAMEPLAWKQAVTHKRCWVCGGRLGGHLAFVIGPMCGVTRTTSEPPCHLDCALWSARNCPFLSRPQMVRRDLEPDYPEVIQPAGNHIDRNPGCMLIWVCRDYEVFSDGKGGYLIHVGDPEAVSFYAAGKPATRAQIEESVNTGLPFLVAADPRPEALAQLEADIRRFNLLLPPA